MTIPPEAEYLYPAPGEIINDKYRVERLLGVGGMGAVAQATHLLRKAPVALKFMTPEIAARGSYVERFINEAVAASRIDSEHVVKIFDVAQLPDGTPFLVMEYLEGMDLAEVLAQDGDPGLASVPRCIHFAVQILRGLQLAHDAGIIHRDMKPSNCFVIEREGEADFVKVFDFGISKLQQADDVKLTQTNSLLGTPLYMAPEQARSAKLVDHRTDLYAVGVILYELLTGKPPFYSEDSFAALMIMIATDEAVALTELRPDIPPQLAAVVHRAFARDPNDRYQSAFELSEALAPWCDDRSHAVIDAARRRAARVTGLPATLLSPGQSTPAEAPTAASPATSAWPPKTEAVDPNPQTSHAGLSTTAAEPAPPARTASRAIYGLAAVALVAVAVVVSVFAFRSAGNEPSSLSDLSAVEADPATSPPVADRPAETSAPVVVVDEEPEAPTASVSASVSAAPPTQPLPKRPPPPRNTTKGPPRLGDITIQK
jgi:eukaryotic-like serine/threonine-protein kinase